MTRWLARLFKDKMASKVVQRQEPMRMPWRDKCKSISGEQNCLMEVIYSSKQVVLSAEMASEVIQRLRPIRMPWGAKCESISVEQNCLVEGFYSPKHLVPSAQMGHKLK